MGEVLLDALAGLFDQVDLALRLAPLIVNFFESGYRRVGGLLRCAGLSAAPSVRQHAFCRDYDRLKIVTFALLGFAFGPYLAPLIGLVTFSFIGSYAGKLLLNRLPEQIFRVALKRR